ncbi:hypothetical protein MUG84_26775 [Paenibacillus sp. KQZ6P-2]|uniref:Uncharacterized protein n=1 Tax=Paenibacillus mangrovi TaxID=2931978 RepID=A0A9X1WWQ0_9BACL|nr:hypothetical protein [Paenibacillus mangrovi]MCJ8015275.1 hypothetical protein [Paenibacillus mangrovi]
MSNTDTANKEKELLCTKDIMKRLNMGRNAATEIMNKLNPVQIGKRKYVSRAVLEYWIKTSKTI